MTKRESTDASVKETVAKAQADRASSISSADTVTPHIPVDPVVHEVVTDAQRDAHHETLDQLNQQLATIRGLPQYATEERDLTARIAALTASRA